MGSYLDEALGIPSGSEHGRALTERMADGLLHVNVCASLECGDHGKGVPVVWGGDNADLGLLFGEHLAIVAVAIGLIAGKLGYFCGCCGDGAFIYISNADDFRLTGFHCTAKDIVAPPARANNGGAVPGTVLSPHRSRQK